MLKLNIEYEGMPIHVDVRFIHNINARMTQCHIYASTSPTNELHILGVALCHYKDNYNKETGRKIALTNALQDAGFPKVIRTQIWKAYHNRAIPNDAVHRVNTYTHEAGETI